MISNNKLKLTKSTIDKIPFSTNRQCHYWDANIIGFGLRVGKGKKVFIVLRRINGKLVKRTIGSYGVFTPDQARVRAQELLLGMAMGKDPKVEEDRLKIRKITLGEAFNSYMEIRKSMKPRTIHSYEWMFNRYFGDWADKNLELITTEMVIKRHTEIGASSAGEAQANYAMRILRAVINFAMRRFKTADGIPVFLVNPVVSGLSDLKGWYRDKRKTRLLKREELPDFYKAVIDLKENSISTRANVLRDYFLLILLSGFRKLEAARIKLVDLNFTSKTFTAWDTKNSEAHTLPMSDYLFKLFKRRYENRVAGNPYVFPGNDGGHITEYRKQFSKVTKTLGRELSLHDLRRTFATIADGLVSSYEVKLLLNHKSGDVKRNGDVTAGYVIKSVEDLRPGMQKISETILEYSKAEKCKPVKEVRFVAKLG